MRPPGLRSWGEVVSTVEERELIARIDASDLQPFRFQGWLGKRLTRSFGWAYDFDNGRFEQAPPLPEWLLPIREVAVRAAGLDADALVQALLIRYDPGAGIGWHKDRPVFEHVVGLSLGNPATLRFRRRSERSFERFAHETLPRSLYHLTGEARHEWEHSIVQMMVPRWSITFRSLAERAGRPRGRG
jgi:DNA oxidative demethylase